MIRRGIVAHPLLSVLLVAATGVGGLALTPPSPPTTTIRAGGTHVVETIAMARTTCSPVTVGVTDHAGRPVTGTVWIEAVMPTMGITEPRLRLTPTTRGVWSLDSLCLPMAGPWTLLLDVRTAAGVDRTTIPVASTG